MARKHEHRHHRKKRNQARSTMGNRLLSCAAVVIAIIALVGRFRRLKNNLSSKQIMSTDVAIANILSSVNQAENSNQETIKSGIPSSNQQQQKHQLPNDWHEIVKLRGKMREAQNPLAAKQKQQQPSPNKHNNNGVIVLKSDALMQRYFSWDKSPIVLEKYKLVFFTVPKVGCTVFKQLFRRMMGFPNWQDHQYYKEPFLPHNPDKNGLRYLADYPLEKANEMLTSPEWTRAVFIRNPQERVLSAYLDKAAYSKGHYLRQMCCGRLATGSDAWQMINCGTSVKGYTEPQPGEVSTPILSFENFLEHIMPACPDPHWETQATRMAPKYWERVNFVGRFESIHDDTKRLLQQIGAWEEFGASGWPIKGGEAGEIFDKTQKVTHGTKAQDKESKSEYFTAKALNLIQQYYAIDFEHDVLKFEKPVIPQ